MTSVLGIPLTVESMLDTAVAIPAVTVRSVVQLPFASVHLVSQSVVTTSTNFGQGMCDWVCDHAESASCHIPERTLGPVCVGPMHLSKLGTWGPYQVIPEIHTGPIDHDTAQKVGTMGKSCIGAAGGITHSAFGVVGILGSALGGRGPVGVFGASMESAERVVNATLGGFAEMGQSYNKLAGMGAAKVLNVDGIDSATTTTSPKVLLDESQKKWESVLTTVADLRGVRCEPVPKFVGLAAKFDEKHLYPYGNEEASVQDDTQDDLKGRETVHWAVVVRLGKLIQHGTESARGMVNTAVYSGECFYVRIQEGVVGAKDKLLSLIPIPLPRMASVDAVAAVLADLGRSIVGATGGIVYVSLGCARNVGKAMQIKKNCSHTEDGVVAAGIHGGHDVANACLCSCASVGCAVFRDVGNVGLSFIDDVLGSSERTVEKIPMVGKPVAFMTVGMARRITEFPFKAGTWSGCKIFGGIAELGGVAPVAQNPVTIPEAGSQPKPTAINVQWYPSKMPIPLSSIVSTYQPAVPKSE